MDFTGVISSEINFYLYAILNWFVVQMQLARKQIETTYKFIARKLTMQKYIFYITFFVAHLLCIPFWDSALHWDECKCSWQENRLRQLTYSLQDTLICKHSFPTALSFWYIYNESLLRQWDECKYNWRTKQIETTYIFIARNRNRQKFFSHSIIFLRHLCLFLQHCDESKCSLRGNRAKQLTYSLQESSICTNTFFHSTLFMKHL